MFIEDFDLTMDRALAQGVDLWLNTPRRPLEACGIGGMKAGANGSLNLSTLDGWWDEVWNDADPAAPPIGWCIGTAKHYEDLDVQDASDARSLYDTLEYKIVPTFYDRDAKGLPRAWLASIRQSMASLAPTWSVHRMVHDYVESFYLPGACRAALARGRRWRPRPRACFGSRATTRRVALHSCLGRGCHRRSRWRDAGRDRCRPRFPRAF